MTGITGLLIGSGGASSAVVNFTNKYVSVTHSGAAATAAYRVNTDGKAYQGINGTFTVLEQWVTPTSEGGNYEVYATVSSGTLSTGTVNAWVATSGNPTWTRTAASAGTANGVYLSMQVRRVGSTAVLDTWTVSLNAERV